MRKIEKENIVSFLDAIIDNDYNRANSNLGVLIKEKLRNKLMESKHAKPFGKDEKCESCEEDSDSEKSSKSKKDSKSKNNSKSDKNSKPKKGKLPPWLNKKNKKSK
jgi:hypothetical protein